MAKTSWEAPGGTSRRSLLRLATGAAGVTSGALALAACGAATGSQPASTSATPVTVSLMIKQRSSPAAEDLLRKLFADHNQEEPAVQVNIELVESADVLPKLTTRAAGGQAQDFVESGGFAWVGLAQSGAFTELTPLFKRDKVDTKLFLPEALNINSKDGKIWGWPSSVSADAVAFNMDLFDAAGLKYPPVNQDDKDWTMEKFLDYAQKLTRGREQFGSGGALALDFWTAGTYFGQQPWDDAAKKALMNTPGYIRGLQYGLDLRDKFRVVPTADEVNTIMGGQKGPSFISGKIGMVLVGPFVITKPPFRWGLATLPYSGTGRNIAGRQWSHGLFMGAIPTDRKEGVWRVFKWLLKPENAGRYVVQNGHAVSALAKGGSDYPQQYYQQQSGADAKAYLLSAQYSHASGWGMLNWPKYNDVDAQHQPLWADLVGGRISPGDYAQRAADLWTRGLTA
jgi:ABC-type glycerol-3-phosphate transport system substrate-binding protein